jgi:hypothetical protein
VMLVQDETFTDGLAVDLIGEESGSVGYPERVQTYYRYFGHLDAGAVFGLLHPDPRVAAANLIMEMLDKHAEPINDVTELREALRYHWHTLTTLMPRLLVQCVGEFEPDFENTDLAFDRFWNQNENNLKLRYWGNAFTEQNQYFSES